MTTSIFQDIVFVYYSGCQQPWRGQFRRYQCRRRRDRWSATFQPTQSFSRHVCLAPGDLLRPDVQEIHTLCRSTMEQREQNTGIDTKGKILRTIDDNRHIGVAFDLKILPSPGNSLRTAMGNCWIYCKQYHNCGCVITLQ